MTRERVLKYGALALLILLLTVAGQWLRREKHWVMEITQIQQAAEKERDELKRTVSEARSTLAQERKTSDTYKKKVAKLLENGQVVYDEEEGTRESSEALVEQLESAQETIEAMTERQKFLEQTVASYSEKTVKPAPSPMSFGLGYEPPLSAPGDWRSACYLIGAGVEFPLIGVMVDVKGMVGVKSFQEISGNNDPLHTVGQLQVWIRR